MKRIFDIFVAVLVLLILAPVFILLIVVIRCNLGGPVLFWQVRPGMHGVPFKMVKFRTMRNVYDEQGNPLPDAQRMTGLGAFLRKLSLDELPELWNVIKGEMSLVGPRPLLMEYLPLYSPEQARRHEVRPGITGWAQVNGRNAITWDEKFDLDIWYVEHRSLLLDIKILLLTIIKVFIREGISQEGHPTVDKFGG